MISYDTNVLIYALETSDDIGLQAQSIVSRGESEGATLSIIVKQELLTGALLRGVDTGNIDLALASLGATTFRDVDESVVDKALELTKKYGRKCMQNDAIIIATAILAGARVFYTNDDQLLRAGITEIRICRLDGR